jgi:hypothetical protein
MLSVVVASVLGGLLSTGIVQANPVFNFTIGSGLSALQGSNPTLANTVIADFRTAGNHWSSIFSDNVTLNIAIDFKPLGAGILGETGSNYAVATYTTTRTALNVDKKTTDDSTAVKNLPAGNALSFLTNSSSGQVILDNTGSANNVYLAMPTANAKALGLSTPTATAQGASITFSSSFNFDFDPTNSITAGQYDFVGVATHEIGHSLGFVSRVDEVDYYSGPRGPARLNLDPYAVVSPLDLFRYSAPGVLNLAYGGTPYFSINRGATSLGKFSTGAFNGDGRQASHWKDNLGLGIMDPTLASGELAKITALDIKALDVIGWDRIPGANPAALSFTSLSSSAGPPRHTIANPEPSTIGLLSLGLLGAAVYRRRTRRQRT